MATTAELQVQVDPTHLGFDPDRLRRIDAHFGRYVEDRRLPGALIAVARHGELAHVAALGHRDVEGDLPVTPDTVYRIFSMTKPVTSVAAMMLYEQGLFDLKAPVHRFIPSFRETRVLTGGSALAPRTEPTTEPVRIWHLLTHTAGLTYGFHHAELADALYRRAGFEWGSPKGMDLAASCDAWARLPLAFQPGTRFNYSVATDVLGRVVEVVSGQSLDAFFDEHILGPLGMHDTSFQVGEADLDRLAALYVPNPADDGRIARFDRMGSAITKPPRVLSGGGGLASTAGDYLRFCELLRRGGELDGVRLLSPRTVRAMATNHLPGGVDLEAFGQSTWSETTFDGVGFGLGFAVVLEPPATRNLVSAGTYLWGGAASTGFYVDPHEDVTAVLMTQLLPSSTYDLRAELQRLVNQALVD